MENLSKRQLVQRRRIFRLSLWLMTISLAVVAVKQLPIDPAQWLARQLSLSDLPRKLQSPMREVCFIPLGAVAVVFTRLSLGLRILGPFRSILLGIAFHLTGLPLGLSFLVMTTIIIMLARRELRQLGLNYFGRITIMLSVVALFVAATVLVGHRL